MQTYLKGERRRDRLRKIIYRPLTDCLDLYVYV